MATLRMNPAALRQLLMGNQGPVGRDLALRSQRVVNAAKRRCPADSGRLRNSIRFTMFIDSRGLVSMIGTDVEYALFVHEGTRPHFPPLAALQPWASRHGFGEGSKGAYPVAGKIARYGTKGRPFLTEALRAVGGS